MRTYDSFYEGLLDLLAGQMNKILNKLLRHELIKGSFFVFIGSTVGNFSAYLFHIIVGRMLKPEEYAVIASLISFLYIAGFPTAMFNTVIVRKMASLSAKNDYQGIKSIFNFFLIRILFFCLAITIFFFIVKKPIADFLKIENSMLIFITGLTYAFSLFSTVNMATLQGLLKFFSYSWIQIVYSIFKVFVTFMAIFFGFGVFGVTTGLLIITILYCVLSLKPLAFVFKYKERKQTFAIKTYLSAMWIGMPLVGMGLMVTTDLLLVKHFFSSFDAGLYAAMSTIGRVILFATSSIAVVLLPLSTKKKESGQSSRKVFELSQLLSISVSLLIVLIYFYYPDFIVTIFYGKNYHSISSYLGLIGIYFLFYNISNLFVNYYISLRKQKILVFPIVCAVTQVVLISLFHSSFSQILYVMISSILLLLIIFVLYYFKYER